MTCYLLLKGNKANILYICEYKQCQTLGPQEIFSTRWRQQCFSMGCKHLLLKRFWKCPHAFSYKVFPNKITNAYTLLDTRSLLLKILITNQIGILSYSHKVVYVKIKFLLHMRVAHNGSLANSSCTLELRLDID